MNQDAMPGFVKLTQAELSELTTEVKETIAFTEVPDKKAHKSFTAAQLWFHHRYMWSASKRIRK